MPGIVVFRRRWSVGSDDLVVPGVFLFTVHLIWTIILAALILLVEFDRSTECVLQLWQYILGYLGVLGMSLLTELCICIIAMRGSILDTGPRASMQYILYVRVVVLLVEMGWLVLGIVWLVYNYRDCPIERAKEIVLGLVICNWCILMSILITVWCTYDTAGRSWVKMKQYQRSMRESESRFQYKRSGSHNRNWRQRKVLRAYQDSWDQRCRFLFCCMRPSDRNRNSFADIAKLLSDFFRDLDVVPSDVIAGLVLLRKFQKIEREAIVKEHKNDTYEFLSGVPVTPRTKFLRLNDPAELDLFQTVIHYMNYALGAYGWPFFLMTNSATGICQLCTNIRCACLPCFGSAPPGTVVEDNCCFCNYAALQTMLQISEVEIIYATYHVDVAETPFFVAIDYNRQSVVVSIRGTLSMKDVLTDLNAESEPLPLNPPRDDWLGHKGMVQAAEYIRQKLIKESILEQAFNHNPDRGTHEFNLVCVGHSLGAGTASILAILLKQDYPNLKCFSFSPPGGLLSLPAVQFTKDFTISVVVGKDVVPRVGLYQMEALRADLINAIKRSVDPKWKTITCSVFCCGCGSMPTSAVNLKSGGCEVIEAYMSAKNTARSGSVHPSDSSIALTLHPPLFPPGRIIHVVRHHPTTTEQALSKHEPVYQAIWAENTDFDEVLISPVMIQDHMPDKVLEALNKVITTFGPRKPQRISNNNSSIISGEQMDPEQCHLLQNDPLRPASPKSSTPAHKLCLETSFATLQSPTNEMYQNNSNNSSLTGSFFPKISPIQLHSILHPDMNYSRSPSWQHGSSAVTSPQSNVFISDTEEQGPSNDFWNPKISSRIDAKDPKSFRSSFSVCNFSTNQEKVKFRPKVFSLDIDHKVDLIHDDWFGLAPLASPESLSEVSSICSRASFLDKTNLTEVISTSYELRTPRVMRRTPKISGNLSTCADDIKSVRYFQKLGKSSTFLRCSSQNNSINSSGDLSYESATSIGVERCCSKQDLRAKSNTAILETKGFECLPSTSKPSYLNYLQNKFFDLNTSTETDSFQSAENIIIEQQNKTEVSLEPGCNSGCPFCPCDKKEFSKCCQNYDHSDCKLRPNAKPIPKIYMETHFDNEIYTNSRIRDDNLHLNLPGPSCSSGRIYLQSSPSSSKSDTTQFSVFHPRDNVESPIIKLTSSPTQILSPTSPEIDPDLISNLAIDLNLNPENRTTLSYGLNAPLKYSKTSKGSSSIDSGSICKTPSESKTVSFSPQITSIDPSIIQKGFHDSRQNIDIKSIMKETTDDPTHSSFDLRFMDKKYDSDPKSTLLETGEQSSGKVSKKSDKWYLLPKRSPRKDQQKEDSSKSIFTSKRQTSNEKCFTKNESLPLLSGLSSNAEKNSPSYVRRKKYVYPITKVGRNESSV